MLHSMIYLEFLLLLCKSLCSRVGLYRRCLKKSAGKQEITYLTFSVIQPNGCDFLWMTLLRGNDLLHFQMYVYARCLHNQEHFFDLSIYGPKL